MALIRLFFLVTGYRTKDKLTNLIGGSCKTTDNEGQFKIRLQIYVCTTEDITSGNCEQCKSEGCYYKGIICFKNKEVP